MNKYGQVAIKAGYYVKDGIVPADAWKKASCEIFEPSSNSQKKVCPKEAFLGLYGGVGKNAEYARKGFAYLKNNPDSNISPNALWRIINEGKSISYNQQMHVVIAMYIEGLI